MLWPLGEQYNSSLCESNSYGFVPIKSLLRFGLDNLTPNTCLQALQTYILEIVLHVLYNVHVGMLVC